MTEHFFCKEKSPETEETNSRPQKGIMAAAAAGRLMVMYGVFLVLLAVAFLFPLLSLIKYSREDDLHSHAVLIPLVSAFLIWNKWEWKASRVDIGWRGPVVWAMVGVGFLVAGWVLKGGDSLTVLSLQMSSFVCFVIGGFHGFLGGAAVRKHWFALFFLIFIIPLPPIVATGIEIFFQHTSAALTGMLLKATPTPVFQDGLFISLPGLNLEVARECSGIRSSLVLLITSLLAGHMFLQSKWRKTMLTLAVIPLGILRNAIRIVTIAMLTVHVDPEIIHGPLHRRGGPLFFAMSVVLLVGLLLWLRRRETMAGLQCQNSSVERESESSIKK